MLAVFFVYLHHGHNPDIMKRLTIFLLIALPFLFSCTQKEQDVRVESVSISPASKELAVGETLQLSATVSPSMATRKDITWSSSKSSVASVSASGLVTALGEGTTTITAAADGKKGECQVSVVKGFVAVSEVRLNKTEIVLYEGEEIVLIATVSPDDATESSLSWASSNNSIATVDDGRIIAIHEGETTITAKAGGITANCLVHVKPCIAGNPMYSKPEKVDMGLPSGLLWASFNLGATKPGEFGDFFAWGEIEPYYNSLDPLTWKDGKETGYAWLSYKWCMGSPDTITKYCVHSENGYNGYTDERTILELDDDAAHMNLGSHWRMPTKEDFQELLDNCSRAWTSEDEKSGYLFISKHNGNRLFFPDAGGFEGTDYYPPSQHLHYWISSLNTAGASSGAWFVDFGWGKVYCSGNNRFCGKSIRPVYDDK